MGTVDYHGAKRFMTFFFFPQDLMAQVFLKRQLPVRPQAMGMFRRT